MAILTALAGTSLATIIPASAPIAQQADATTRFTRDPALLRQKQAQIVAAMRSTAPEAAADVERLFAQDIIAMIAPSLRELGLDHQDMADMTTAYWVAAWEASQGIVGRKTDRAIMTGARNQIAGIVRSNPALAQMSDAEKQDVADTMMLQAILIEARMGAASKAGGTMPRQMSDTIHAEANQLLNTDLRQVTLSPAGFTPNGGARANTPAASTPTAGNPAAGTAAPPPRPAAAPAAGAHAANWNQVDGVFFRAFTTFGVGGIVITDYEPVILFKDGSYYEIEGDALEDVDLAASRRAKPRNWGRWSKTGRTYNFTNSQGRASDAELQNGNFFQSFPGEASGGKLAAKYTRVSGGGNSAMGGEMTISSQSDLTFAADGRYTRASSFGAIGSGSMSGVGTSVASRNRPAGVGRYTIDRHTITLTEPDGTTKRQFFAFGSRGDPAQPAQNMLFIGNRVYIILD
ncbi:hypothetical protein GRI97_09550 [Altererythrobacter xixiisoli]|uniref:Uncharacterized protein n=1 Tax=Croceibacterium xixiisoli TaxID=1476466 RepID=A0A6I4TTP3_9SPHN|nr:hypothetical protein [Croceibacterium xixiisoli]MXO99232.1 hypothetical protein [Croceibacterium xixiisoli]